MFCHYEDTDMLILEKPAGLLSVPGRGEDKQDCLWRRAQELWPDALIVHRLDCATSGLMVLARSKESHRQLSMQFQQRRNFKRYQALVSGYVSGWDGARHEPMRCDWERRPLQMIDFEQGKSATTYWHALAHEQVASLEATRLALYPITGRSHQLRLHMQVLGHPILGDNLYADGAALESVDRLMLHADLLELFHPSTDERLSFRSAAPF